MSNENSNRIVGRKIQVGSSFVLPIEQSKVTMSEAKVKKIMEETDAQVQQIISNAENKSQVIIQTANTEATRIIEDARKKAQQEYDTIKEQAYQEGFKKGEEDGLNKFKEDAKDGLESLETLAKGNFDIKKNIIDSATTDIVELVSTISEKVCNQSFNEQILYDITTSAINQLNDKETITIIVSPKLVDAIIQMEPNFREQFTNLQSLKIIEDNSLSPDGVIVETPSKRLDSRVSSQIAEITQKMLLGADDGME